MFHFDNINSLLIRFSVELGKHCTPVCFSLRYSVQPRHLCVIIRINFNLNYYFVPIVFIIECFFNNLVTLNYFNYTSENENDSEIAVACIWTRYIRSF